MKDEDKMDLDDTSQTASENDSQVFENNQDDTSSQGNVSGDANLNSHKMVNFRDVDGSGGKSSKPNTSGIFQQPKTRASSGTSAGYNTRGEDKISHTGWREKEKESGNEIRDKTARDETSSFLESLTEDERKTRTRYLPDIDGFSMLTKAECKNDMKEVRSSIYKSSRKDCFSDSVTTGLGEDVIKSSKKLGPFVPLDEDAISFPTTDDQSTDKSSEVAGSTKVDERKLRGKNGFNLMAPFMVESMTVFNPLRPPESGGTSKKRRLNRWEKHPEEIETDLETYRCTVQQTRKELRRCEAEREKIESIGQVLKCHFLQHIQLMRQESFVLSREMEKIQSSYTTETDLVPTLPRRGSVMKDAVMKLQNQGGEMTDEKKCPANFGPEVFGSKINLKDVIDDTKYIESVSQTHTTSKMSSNRRIVPGNKVRTSYGNGIIKDIIGTTAIKNYKQNGSRSQSVHVHLTDFLQINEKKSCNRSYTIQIVPPRYVVQLTFGIAYMNPSEVELNEDPSTYSDSQLCSRWREMTKAALCVSGSVDPVLMQNFLSEEGYNKIDCGRPNKKWGHKIATNVCEEKNDTTFLQSDQESNSHFEKFTEEHYMGQIDEESSKKRLLNFGDTLLANPGARGAPTLILPIGDLKQEIDQKVEAIFTNKGFVAADPALITPDGFRDWEKERTELYEYKAKLMQLQNTLTRQLQYKSHNERLLSSMSNNYDRLFCICEELQAELHQMKGRNKEDLLERGITIEEAKDIYLIKAKEHKEVDVDRSKKRTKKRSDSIVQNIQPRASRRKAEEAAKARDDDIMSQGTADESINDLRDLERDYHEQSRNGSKRARIPEETGIGHDLSKPKRNNRRP